MLDKLQKRIQSLVPEIIDKEFINLPIARDIKLEDVLVAIEKYITVTPREYEVIYMEVLHQWHLNKPLHEQEKECIEFLSKLLVTDK